MQGHIVEGSFHSKYIPEGDILYQVYLPPCYSQTERRYPVLLMQHGLGEGGDQTQWDRLGLDEAADRGYAAGTLPPMIIVMPDGNNTIYSSDTSDYPAIIVEELLPLIDQEYCTWSERFGRAIGGLSRGGFWALWIAFTHPEMFSRVGGHSPFLYPADGPEQYNPTLLVRDAPQLEALTVYLDRAEEDIYVQEGVDEFALDLERRGIKLSYVINPEGNHLESYWSEHTDEYLAFYADQWPRDVSEFPSCHTPIP